MRLLERVLGFIALAIPVAIAASCWSQPAASPQTGLAIANVPASAIESAVEVLCKPADIQRAKDGHISGCRSCPQGTAFQRESGINLEIHAEITGHFTSAHEENLILEEVGCEPHSLNFGGSFVFSLKDGTAHLDQYHPRLMTDQCRRFDYEDGRNFLVCRGGWGGQGYVMENVNVVSFASTGKESVIHLISTRENMDSCDDDPKGITQESGIKGIRFTPENSGQITGLTVTATRGNVHCAQKPPREAKAYEIEFLFDGKQFKPAPASRAVLLRFQNN